MVVDSTDMPKLDEAFRKIFARELGRADFKYLINTHGHGDHTNGNGVYADCQVIAQESVPAMMRQNFANLARSDLAPRTTSGRRSSSPRASWTKSKKRPPRSA